MKYSIITAAIVSTLVWSTAGTTRLAAQTPAPARVPRTADGHPDLSGVWWRGADVGGRTPSGGSVTAPAGGRGATPPPTFASLYQPSAMAKAKTLSDKDDPALGCVNTAFGTLNVSLFDVGAVGQIVQTPKFVVMLTETYNSFQIIPTDGRPHRDSVPPSNRGDAIGRWEGDTLVVDKTNFTDTSWISAEGRVSFHSDALHIVERYRRVDANTLEIEATLEDPKVLTKPWVVPKQTLVLAPFDQIMELACSNETQSLVEGAAKQNSAKN
ncbi:MAG: hypothetical protein JWO19_1647 [Bryobacterales bacterium]|nr:hypothetical protein [Bryobacterales bacterium]